MSPTSTETVRTIEDLVNLFNRTAFSSKLSSRQILKESYSTDLPLLTLYNSCFSPEVNETSSSVLSSESSSVA